MSADTVGATCQVAPTAHDSTDPKIYFPGLNGLRFIAAFIVVLDHIEQLKTWFGLSPIAFLAGWGSRTGDYAVTLFFTLSGFLITYLLLAEQRQAGTIKVRKFYLRRILRIWPLYYLVVLIGFVAFPPIIVGIQDYSGPRGPYTLMQFVLHILLAPNFALYLGVLPAISHLWTIGVEEQFYLMWPLLMRRFARQVPRVLVAIVALKLAVYVVPYLTANLNLPVEFYHVIGFLTRFRIENMAVGGIGAYLVFSQHRALRVIFHPVVEKIILAAVFYHTLFYPTRPITPDNFALSVLYTLFMLNLACNPRSTVKLEHPVLNRLGQISYGIYMYHIAVIYLVMIALKAVGTVNDVILYVLVTALTIGIAALSYDYFEQPFLNLKKRFAVLDSGDSAIQPASQNQVPIVEKSSNLG